MWIFANFCRSDFPRETMGCPHVFVSFTPGEAQKFSEPPFSGCVGKLKWAEKPGWWPKILGSWEAKMLNLALIWSKAWYPGVQKAAKNAGRCWFPCDLSPCAWDFIQKDPVFSGSLKGFTERLFRTIQPWNLLNIWHGIPRTRPQLGVWLLYAPVQTLEIPGCFCMVHGLKVGSLFWFTIDYVPLGNSKSCAVFDC